MIVQFLSRSRDCFAKKNSKCLICKSADTSVGCGLVNRLSDCVSARLCEWSSALPHPSIISRLQVSPSLSSFSPILPSFLLSTPFQSPRVTPAPSPLPPSPPTKRCHPSPPPSSLPLPVGRASYHVGDMSGLVQHTVCCLRAAAWRLVEWGAEQLICGVAATAGCSNRGA